MQCDPIVLLLLVLTQLGACTQQQLPLLFVDDTVLVSWDFTLSLRVHPPRKGPRVIIPDKPWETWAVFAYNHVMEVPVGTVGDRYRLYYDCIEGAGVPPGAGNLGSLSHRRICLATSNDGLVWVKPNVGLFNLNGSTANNILLEDSGVSVFIDHSPEAKTSGLIWKMVCSQSAYASADGIKWSRLPFKPVAVDDTKPTAYWDNKLKKYVISVRRDLAPDWFRTIGRCVTSNLSDWESELNINASGCPVVFAPDSKDPVCHTSTDCPGAIDIYTNAWTPYPSPEAPAVHFFFPSMYYHFNQKTPYGFGNDGLLDIRMVVSRTNPSLNLAQTKPYSNFVPNPVTPQGWSQPPLCWTKGRQRPLSVCRARLK